MKNNSSVTEKQHTPEQSRRLHNKRVMCIFYFLSACCFIITSLLTIALVAECYQERKYGTDRYHKTPRDAYKPPSEESPDAFADGLGAKDEVQPEKDAEKGAHKSGGIKPNI